MNRLQKKCLIATAGFHLLLVLVIVFGSAFFVSRTKPDETQVLTVIPANLIDAVASSGVKAAQPPAPQPIVQPPPPAPQPQPPQPQPAPTFIQRVKEIFTPTPEKLPPDDMKPVENTPKPQPHKVQPDLKLVTHVAPKVTDTSAADDARETKHQRDARLKAIAAAARAIKENASAATEINLPGNSSVAYANYGAAVVSAYHQAWIAPDNMASATAVVTFSVTIARDGHVISSNVVAPSGDAAVDNAVQRMLDHVSFIGAFPDDSKDQQRTYNIDFNATRTSPL